IRYGEQPAARVRAPGGQERPASLEEVAALGSLDVARAAPAGVEAVSLTYPVPLCQLGVALYDTPGLNDRAEQDETAARALELADLVRSEEHTSELQSPYDLVCRLLLEKKKKKQIYKYTK